MEQNSPHLGTTYALDDSDSLESIVDFSDPRTGSERYRAGLWFPDPSRDGSWFCGGKRPWSPDGFCRRVWPDGRWTLTLYDALLDRGNTGWFRATQAAVKVFALWKPTGLGSALRRYDGRRVAIVSLEDAGRLDGAWKWLVLVDGKNVRGRAPTALLAVKAATRVLTAPAQAPAGALVQGARRVCSRPS